MTLHTRPSIVSLPALLLVLAGAPGCTGEIGGPEDLTGSAELSVRHAAGGTDRFGVRAFYPTLPSGRVWHARWDGPRRTLGSGQVDPYDPEFHNRGSGTTFAVHGDGTATASGGVMRHYIWDRGRGKTWGDIELTFYAMRVSERADAPSRAGFTVEVRTGDGHTSDPSRQCRGHAYAASFRYWGGAQLGKELKHPIYADEGGPEGRNIWDGGDLPRNQWIGFKLVTRDVPEGVRLELYRDLTDGRDGGEWELVLSYTDRGGWGSSEHDTLCGEPSDRVLRGAYPAVLLRNDGSTMRYKNASVREIHAVDGMTFVDIGRTSFRDDIEWLAERGIARGCNPPWNTWYCPDDAVTRGQMAALLRRALDLPAGSGDTFTDDDGSVFEADIEAIAAAGITRGCNPPQTTGSARTPR